MDHRPLPALDIGPAHGPLPVLLSIPHSGRTYPPWLILESSGGIAALQTLEDPLVDRLAWRALGCGVGAVIARAPRAAIDCNRAPDEVDPAVVAGAAQPASPRARAGLGIIPGRTGRHGHLWRRPIARSELDRRIAMVHAPYHAALALGLNRLAIANGTALLLDIHSMPSRTGQAELVIGDRHGTTASRDLIDAAARMARAQGWSVALNTPYAGGHVIERHGRPGDGIHALQLEIDRRCYLDANGRTPGRGFDRAARLIEQLVLGLADLIRLPALAAE